MVATSQRCYNGIKSKTLYKILILTQLLVFTQQCQPLEKFDKFVAPNRDVPRDQSNQFTQVNWRDRRIQQKYRWHQIYLEIYHRSVKNPIMTSLGRMEVSYVVDVWSRGDFSLVFDRNETSNVRNSDICFVVSLYIIIMVMPYPSERFPLFLWLLGTSFFTIRMYSLLLLLRNIRFLMPHWAALAI